MTAPADWPPFAAATPAEVRALLVPDERPRFDVEYRQALDVAAETLSLDELDATMGSWRRIAWLCTDQVRYHQMWRRAARSYTGEAAPRESRCRRPRPEWASNTVYCVATDERIEQQIAALPPALLDSFAEACILLEVQPWAGLPFYRSIPAGPVRNLPFGDTEMVTYLVLDDLCRAELLEVWAA